MTIFNIYTDGSSQHNGKPHGFAGWAMVAVTPAKKFIRYGHLAPPSTNGRGEIAGVLYGIATFFSNPNIRLNFISDAQYVVNSINRWRLTNRGNGVKNMDMLKPLYAMWEAHGNSSIEWVKGHSGDFGNEIADEWADKGCRQIIMDSETPTESIRFISDKEFKCHTQNSLRKTRLTA